MLGDHRLGRDPGILLLLKSDFANRREGLEKGGRFQPKTVETIDVLIDGRTGAFVVKPAAIVRGFS